MKNNLPVRHIGIITAICNNTYKADLRTDLPYARYKQLGVKERFAGEARYRICNRCLHIIKNPALLYYKLGYTAKIIKQH